jgi:PII-like signaling protein
VNDACLKLTTYFGERDRATDGRFLADAFTDIYARHGIQTSLVLRGTSGFGAKQRLHTDRLLSLSEDLPLVSVAVDTRARIEHALDEVRQLSFDGLITLERARMLTERLPGAVTLPWQEEDETKLTAYVGRHERVAGAPAYEWVVDRLHQAGVAGASVLLGVDGTAHGARRRARFFGRNASVPLMVIAVGASARLAGLVPDLAGRLPQPLLTLERVRVCKRDGQRLSEPRHLPETDPSGLAVWQKLMIYSSEQSQHDGHPLHTTLIRRLRQEGAAGATSLRGIWGYHGNHRPHGDSFWQLRRRVPVVTIVVDTPERIRRWFAIVDELTDETGLVTNELVPALRATGPGFTAGGLRLAQRLP